MAAEYREFPAYVCIGFLQGMQHRDPSAAGDAPVGSTLDVLVVILGQKACVHMCIASLVSVTAFRAMHSERLSSMRRVTKAAKGGPLREPHDSNLSQGPSGLVTGPIHAGLTTLHQGGLAACYVGPRGFMYWFCHQRIPPQVVPNR